LEVSGQLHAAASLPPEKEPLGTHCIGGWVDLRAGLDDLEKRKLEERGKLKNVWKTSCE
jgi:hypothetical protein